MIYDLQKASILKRISAWLLDAILLVILVTGAAALIASLTGFDGYLEQYSTAQTRYEEQYDIQFNMTPEEYGALTEEELAVYDTAYEALISDQNAMYAYNMIINLALMIISLSILAAHLVMEFIIPLLLGNGQTLGKKAFSIAVVRTNSVKITPVVLFIRTFLGKYTIETMLPVLVILLLLIGSGGLVALVILAALLVAQIALLIATPTNALIHDKLADTVTVDMTSQMIFATEEDLLNYKKKVAAEKAERETY